MAEQENVEDLLKKLHELMKKQGRQDQEFLVGNEVIKISLQQSSNTRSQSDTSLSLQQRSSSLLQDQQQPKATKKISLGSRMAQEAEVPNSCFRNFFQQEQQDFFQIPQKDNTWANNSFETPNQYQNTQSNHIQQLLNQLQKSDEFKEELSNKLSQSLSTSQNFFESQSTLLSLSLLTDPLCRMVSKHLKSLANGNLKSSNQTPSFLFLYSQPLVMPMRDGCIIPLLSQIDYQKQESNVKKVLHDCKVGYMRQCATVEKVGTWLQSGIQIIHFCGHGVNGTSHNTKGDFLVFEDRDAKGEKVDQESLRQILRRLKKPLQFVFVASCHSKMLGEVFLKAGVPHVICVKQQERILDDACQEFVRLFYLSCINNSMTICESFDFAKLQVSLMGFPKGEANKFVLLKRQTFEEHQCTVLNAGKSGNFRDLTVSPTYGRSIPSRVENFIFRHQIMAEVIAALSKHRFVTIKGIPGIGKSILVRELARYMQFRGKFKDGILYIQLAGCQTIDTLIQSLCYEIFGGVLTDKSSFNDNLDNIVKALNNRHALLILDNCDSILSSNDKHRFKQTTESLLRKCHHVYFLFSNRMRVGDILHSCQFQYCTERVFNLDKLGLEDSKTLFLNKAPRAILTDELDQFLRTENATDLIHHPLFDFLNGHPQAISLSAALLAQRSLKEVYTLLMEQSLADQFSVRHDDKRGYNAFRVSLQVSWNIINKRQPQAALMFRIMGMMPAGLDLDLMPKIFGSKWRAAVQVLSKYSLIKRTERVGLLYYSLHPYILSFAQHRIQFEEKRRYHEKITEELHKRLFDRVYKNIGTLSANQQKAGELYLFEEVNYKACIYREFAFLGDTSKIQTFYRNPFSTLVEQDSSESEQEKRESDNSSVASSIRSSASSKFMEGASVHKKFRQESSDDDTRSLVDQKTRRLASKEKSPKGEVDKSYFGAKKKDPPAVFRLMIYQATILFVMKNYVACQRIVQWGYQLSKRIKSPLSQANFFRLSACLHLANKQDTKAKDFFSIALEIFASLGCGLGAASCQSALGYIRFMESQYALAKKSLQSALKYYKQLSHHYGNHYLNRWLYSIKTKINRQKKQLQNHNEEAKKLVKQAKLALKGNKFDNFLLKHKVGCFVFRCTFDNISLFLQCSFEIDVKPKKIPLSSTKQQSILKNIALDSQKKNRGGKQQPELLPIQEDEQVAVCELSRSENCDHSDTISMDLQRDLAFEQLQSQRFDKPSQLKSRQNSEVKQKNLSGSQNLNKKDSKEEIKKQERPSLGSRQRTNSSTSSLKEKKK